TLPFYLSVAFFASAVLAAPRSETLSLDGEWDFAYARATDKERPTPPSADAYDGTITVPGWWDQQRNKLKERAWFKQATFVETQGTAKFLSGVGWNRTFFDAPDSWRGRSATLTVGRAVGLTDVWLNGRHLAHFEQGVYTPFEVDIADALQ